MKIAFIVPYFGKWPVWFSAFLKSCESNPEIQWIFFTDCEIPEDKPKNVDFHEYNLKDMKALASSKMGFEVALDSPKKLCDFKPAYGDLFSEYLVEYDFWGFCDVDIIWGDITKFITQDLLDHFDIITTLDKMISGHFTVFKNNAKTKSLYKHKEVFKQCFQNEKHLKFDEIHFTQIISELLNQKKIKIFWDKEEIKNGIESVAHQQYLLNNWKWNEGAVFHVQKDAFIKEYMYLHFINWKKNIKSCEVEFKNEINSFYISHSSIHIQPHRNLQIKWNDFRNIFDGYYVRLRRKGMKKKWQRIKKKFLNVKNDK